MAEVNLLAKLPRSRRNVTARAVAKSAEVIAISRQFGQEYFDGPRDYGYGGYRYDGRWIPVAEDIVAHFGLKPGMRVLDVGCAKGFLVKDLMKLGLEVFGLDISDYAIRNCEPEVIGRLHVGNADTLPFPDGSFDQGWRMAY
jgi:cyclopropane fatty-acyl-phospholipid synthase-like methyltransferase